MHSGVERWLKTPTLQEELKPSQSHLNSFTDLFYTDLFTKKKSGKSCLFFLLLSDRCCLRQDAQPLHTWRQGASQHLVPHAHTLLWFLGRKTAVLQRSVSFNHIHTSVHHCTPLRVLIFRAGDWRCEVFLGAHPHCTHAAGNDGPVT